MSAGVLIYGVMHYHCAGCGHPFVPGDPRLCSPCVELCRTWCLNRLSVYVEILPPAPIPEPLVDAWLEARVAIDPHSQR